MRKKVKQNLSFDELTFMEPIFYTKVRAELAKDGVGVASWSSQPM